MRRWLRDGSTTSQCVRVWGDEDWAGVLVTWFARHGVPADVTHELIEQGSYYRPFIRYASGPDLLDAGDRVDGWEVVPAAGHADGAAVAAFLTGAGRTDVFNVAGGMDAWARAGLPIRTGAPKPGEGEVPTG